MFAHLHVRSWFSFLGGGTPPEGLVARAARLGQRTLALTDAHGLYGSVRFQRACREYGVRPVYGAEVRVDGYPLVLLAGSEAGYANLCDLLTCAHLRDRLSPSATLDEAAAHAGDVWCLTGAEGCRLWALLDAGRPIDAVAWVGTLKAVYGERLSVEVSDALTPGSRRRVGRLLRIANRAGAPVLATNDVRHGPRHDYRRYDLLTCVREGTTVVEPHPARPTNGQRGLIDEAALWRRLPLPAAFARAEEVADACRVELVPGEITPPAARLPAGVTAGAHLRALCERGLVKRFGRPVPDAPRAQMEREISVIGGHDLDEFFLVVHELVAEARRRGIRCAGRGSAANSLVAFLLGITNVDPLKHRLLFERFLHAGRKGTPDIDVDFDSERRGEVIAWMEERFGLEQTAMTATLVTYGVRSALRDVSKALGWPMDTINRLAKVVPHGRAGRVRDHRVAIEGVLGSGPLVDRLLEAVEDLEGCPRHLGQHSGGMVLSRRPLRHFTPIQVSANGVKVVQFDKDDVEALGLVKLDVLGLRMLATLSEAGELLAVHEGHAPDIMRLPLDDARTFNLIRAGRTLGCFQIESQGQLHLLGQNQPDTFDDLVTEIALFRPGPLQGNMVNPFVRRRRGEEPVEYDHPDLEPVLSDTFGVILFQEQVLEVAHHFAGMPLDEADEFRRLMSKFRDPGEMEGMRGRFVAGAVGRGVDAEVANLVFERVSKFVGYGFCRSHAAAFAQTVYQSCWFKAHHTAAYMAAVMQHRPGMYALTTLVEDARRMGVDTRPPDLALSGLRYALEPAGRRWAIRMPLSAVREWTPEKARAVVWERMRRPFTDLEDLWTRWPLEVPELRQLAHSGGLDALVGGDARRALWLLGVLETRLGAPGQARAAALFDAPVIDEALDVPELTALGEDERLTWDYTAHGAARAHPMGLIRRALSELEIRPLSACFGLGRLRRPGGPPPRITVAGISVLRQRPPTAKGVLFLTLEDETGMMQCVVRPQVLERLDHVVSSGGVIVRGVVHAAGNWRGLVVEDAWVLDGIFGGYSGHANFTSGRDTHIVKPTSGVVGGQAVGRSGGKEARGPGSQETRARRVLPTADSR